MCSGRRHDDVAEERLMQPPVSLTCTFSQKRGLAAAREVALLADSPPSHSGTAEPTSRTPWIAW